MQRGIKYNLGFNSGFFIKKNKKLFNLYFRLECQLTLISKIEVVVFLKFKALQGTIWRDDPTIYFSSNSK